MAEEKTEVQALREELAEMRKLLAAKPAPAAAEPAMLAEPVMFLSIHHPQLVLVMKPDRQHVVDNVVVNRPPHYIRFVRGPFGGQCRTAHPEEVALLRRRAKDAHSGIIEVKDPATLVRVKPAQEVRQGSISTGARETPPAAPGAPEAPAVRAARIP